MAVVVSGGMIENQASRHPVVLQTLFADQDQANMRAKEQAQTTKRQSTLKATAIKARMQAKDALQDMKRAKFAMEDLVAVAKVNPSYANVAAAKDAAGIYQKAAVDYIGALYAAEYADKAAEGAGIAIASKSAGEKISPGVEAVRQEIKEVERNYAEVAKSQSIPVDNLRLEQVFAAQAEFRITAERVGILYDLAKMPSSTAEDGQNLVMAVTAMKAARKNAYVVERDARIAELMDKGHSEIEARNQYAKELRAERRREDKTGERRQHIEHCVKCNRLGHGLIRGDVQEGRAMMPEAMQKHFYAKQDKKAARAERDVARRDKNAPALQQSVDRYVNASVRMTMGIFRELVAESMTEGYTKAQAKQVALEKFRAEHNRRKNGTDREAREWQKARSDFQMDIGLLRAISGKAESVHSVGPGDIRRHDQHDRNLGPDHRHRTNVGVRELAAVLGAHVR